MSLRPTQLNQISLTINIVKNICISEPEMVRTKSQPNDKSKMLRFIELSFDSWYLVRGLES